MEKVQKNYSVKAFGIAREIVGSREITVSFPGQTVADLKAFLILKYPELGELRSFFIAVNNTYANDELTLRPDDEIGLIPPVSGG